MSEITIKDIAKECGVGISTVSRALNNHPDINPETRQMVLKVIEEQGFIPNNSARNLKRTDAKCIALLVKGITNPFFSRMIQIIEDETQKNRYAMVLRHVEATEDEIDVALELIKEKRLRGIVFLGGSFSHSGEKLSALHVPFVFSTVGVADAIDGIPYSNIAVDDRLESGKMVSHLLELGHRKIAIIAEKSEGISIARLRLDGYEDAYRDRGLPVRPELIRYVDEDINHYSMENGYVTAKRLVESGEEFTAIYATADSMAIGVCRAVLEAGLRIPGDVSVAGFDGLDLAGYYNPALTTVQQPVEEMALATIRLLFDVIAGRREHEHIVFPARLLLRESVGPVPAKASAGSSSSYDRRDHTLPLAETSPAE